MTFCLIKCDYERTDKLNNGKARSAGSRPGDKRWRGGGASRPLDKGGFGPLDLSLALK